MSFTNTPVTRVLVVGIVLSSVAVSLFDAKHYFYILIDPHIWRYRQLWRALTYQLCYTNSTEVLFAGMALYNMRIIERMWGSRKYASFILGVSALSSFITPALFVLLLRPLTGGLFNYLPGGPTAIVFAVLAQYHAMVPRIYQYRIATSAPDQPFTGITASDKTYRYVLAAQLSLLQWPWSLVGAAVGWVLGSAWRSDLIPTKLTRWRVPGWMVGIHTQKRTAEFEGLVRRLEGENMSQNQARGSSSAVDGGENAEGSQRRTMSQQILDQFQVP